MNWRPVAEGKKRRHRGVCSRCGKNPIQVEIIQARSAARPPTTFETRARRMCRDCGVAVFEVAEKMLDDSE